MVALMVFVVVPLRASAASAAGAEPVFSAANAAAAAPVTITTSSASSMTAAISSVAACNMAPPVPASFETRLTLRLVYAAILGAGLGKERSFAKHSAGVRTMALVAMGASAYTICSAYGFANFGHYDPGRMASNVASGVGFVGAGVITTSASRNQNVVHGLTTAATIWLSAAVGVACGVGLFQISTVAAVATVTILRLGRMKPPKINKANKKRKKQQKQNLDEFNLADYIYKSETHADDDEYDQEYDDDDDEDEDEDAEEEQLSFEEETKQSIEDHYADTHVTEVWDEEDPKQRRQEEEEAWKAKKKKKKQKKDRLKKVVTVPSRIDDEIGSLVEQAWRTTNSTDIIVPEQLSQKNSTTKSKVVEEEITGTRLVEQQQRYRP